MDSLLQLFLAQENEAVKFIVLLSLIWSTFWGLSFLIMMLLPDKAYSGRNDKLCWTIAFVFVFPITPIVFLVWLIQLHRHSSRTYKSKKSLAQKYDEKSSEIENAISNMEQEME